MADHAVSSDPAVQAQLDRLATLSPGADILGLERITALLARVGDPHFRLPPVFHVAGTNGKGSTCAFLRAALEASGHTVHVFTSPHLVRFNERIRVAGRLIEDALLADLLREVLDAGADVGASFFEVTTAAAFLAFARIPADACVIEVGLGGRLDATNVIPAPVACGIAQLGIDHQAFLGDTIEQIAAEKAGIAKRGVPLLTQHYPRGQAEQIGRVVQDTGAPWMAKGGAWDATVLKGRLHYHDAAGELELPLPRLPGRHQAGNAALAVAMLRHQQALPIAPTAYRAAMGWAEWPARLQRLTTGALADRMPAGSELWLDGGHNPAAALAIADFLKSRGQKAALIVGILANKDPAGILAPIAPYATSIHAVPIPGHAHHDPDALIALARAHGFAGEAAADVPGALDRILAGEVPPMVLVMGSLYLAGRVLEANGTLPE
ncbi:bifunctional folylpolyglutamate synthase/dihydrofolate synthase [Sphingomonas naphthae]|uniref:Bifunctional folylpolyglutamate synthase/dihydrofolate synthase n=1 Tax=Sphingomonas naphthae TaxID=1813468 RepID=A0ABY7TQM7_9SPHN|nr:folylpolyglutamate synthase/dihydrofolate synthase family protein [Sphingomonas naphthae]WCT75291.1 bifunctional folylpolyglutamate synthase/dihydrofolate synthase [Sphingomonas naphthae]